MNKTPLYNKYFSKELHFTPLSHCPHDDWENRNRRTWTKTEIDALWKKEVGEFEFTIGGTEIFIKPFDRNEAATLYHYESKEPGKLCCGKVLKIGNLSGDRACFPRGTSCTYGDWVLFSIQNCEPCDLGAYTYFLVNDLDVLGVINDPHTIVRDFQ